MDSEGYTLLAELMDTGILGSSKELAPCLVEGYWSGRVQVPSAIDSDVTSYLSQSDTNALTRMAIWIARNHVLSSYSPKHHISVVRWLVEHDLLKRSELLGLLALASLGGGLDDAGKEIALIAREMLEEGRLAEGEDLIEPMLLSYKPSI